MFVDHLKQNWERITSIYDLAAFCYDYLSINIDDEALFLGKYIFENNESEERNPNLEKLHSFLNQLIGIYEKDNVLFDMHKAQKNIQRRIETLENELVEYGETRNKQLSMAFFVLKSVDLFVCRNVRENTITSPLNKAYEEECYVYVNLCDSMIDDAMEELKFSGIICAPSIRSQLLHLNIVEKKDIPNPDTMEVPKVVSLYVSKNDEKRQRILAGKKIKIAVIPFCKYKMLDFPPVKGALFRVEYNEWHQIHGKAWALHLLELAIDKKANIILFPEYVCSEEIQDAIGQRLKDLSEENPRRLQQLLLVVAGSGWTKDDNNISKIYSYNGKLLEKNYKYASYASRDNELIENLQNRGKETTIVEIPGVGRCLIGICRDISDRSYSKRLTELFVPQFLFVPAWSPSVHNGFKKQFDEVTQYNHKTSSILCNCCEAMGSDENFKEDIGMTVIPYKAGSTIEGAEKVMKRKKEKCTEKCKTGGCVYMLSLDYSVESVRKKSVLKRPKQFFCQ